MGNKLKVKRKHFGVDNERTDTPMLEKCLKKKLNKTERKKTTRWKWNPSWVYSFRMLVLHLLGARQSLFYTENTHQTYSNRLIFSIIVSNLKCASANIGPCHWRWADSFRTFFINRNLSRAIIYMYDCLRWPLVMRRQQTPEISVLLCDFAVCSLINENYRTFFSFFLQMNQFIS